MQNGHLLGAVFANRLSVQQRLGRTAESEARATATDQKLINIFDLFGNIKICMFLMLGFIDFLNSAYSVLFLLPLTSGCKFPTCPTVSLLMFCHNLPHVSVEMDLP